ncbi:MAG: DUF3644 domain-containing protein [Candidatus Desulfovibrio kirbyi]|jgi:hypothetical protein|uniref:DUF3644 domain-containing protein n=1 Tax=Candidatus Desulfovibrio kirbyi TaxID=2696086 RepID=A0A6L2R4Q0_9BACT|nr:MAG: DUF3644 domain-containing protein [Candidatus Desulfovibrio kirbyi]
MKSRSKDLLEKSIAAMVAAIEIYNKPSFAYRAEAFAILAINAWELLLKSKWLIYNNNKENSLYVREKKNNKDGLASKKATFKLSRSNNYITHAMDYLAKKLIEEKLFDIHAWKNIEILLEFRNSSIHFYNKNQYFRIRLYKIGAACVKNFAAAIQEWFNRSLSEFELHLMPLAFISMPANVEGMLLNIAERKFLDFLEDIDNNNVDPSSRYSVTVNVQVVFTRSKVKDSLKAKITNDTNALAIRLTQEQVRERHPWDYAELTKRCRDRYINFKADRKYHSIRKGMNNDESLFHINFLDPGNPKSAKKTFYSTNILLEFDKHYTKI